MIIGIDISPLKTGHQFRGTGSYTDNLVKAFKKYDHRNKYKLFVRGELLPKNVDLTHYPYFEPFFLTLPLRKPVPTVVTVHDLTPLVFPDHFPRGLRGEIKWQIQRLALKGVKAIIADSECSKKDVAKFTGISEEKIFVVYLAAGEGFKKVQSSSASWQIKVQSLRKKYNLPEKFALYVGDVAWNKNLPRLVEAVKKINISLVMVGKALVEKDFERNNPWNQDLVKIWKLCEGDEKVIRLGFTPTQDLMMIYNLATVFTMPSIYEGFGLPILEAMSCGCPVVTTKESSLPEVAGSAALYVDAFSVESIARGICEVFNNKKLSEDLTRYGYIQAKKFSWEKVARQTCGVYEKVLAGS